MIIWQGLEVVCATGWHTTRLVQSWLDPLLVQAEYAPFLRRNANGLSDVIDVCDVRLSCCIQVMFVSSPLFRRWGEVHVLGQSSTEVLLDVTLRLLKTRFSQLLAIVWSDLKAQAWEVPDIGQLPSPILW